MTERPARVTRRRAATRQRLLDAALDVFAARGFGRATVEDVCDRAGFTRGAFYSNFASLDDLFFALYTDRAARIVAAVETAVTAAGAAALERPPDDPLADAVDRVLAALPADRGWYLISTEFTAHALRHPDVAHALARHRRALRDALRPVLRGVLDADPHGVDNLARAVVAIQDGMLAQTLLEPDDRSIGDLHRKLMTTVLAAYRAGTRS